MLRLLILINSDCRHFIWIYMNDEETLQPKKYETDNRDLMVADVQVLGSRDVEVGASSFEFLSHVYLICHH